VFGIHLPPLRDRTEDLPLLVEHFLRSIGVSPGPAVSPLAMRRLLQHAWPGNIRQLFSALESARIRSEGETIHIHHLPPEIRGDESGEMTRYGGPDSGDDERVSIEAALEQAGGAKAEAARLLGMSRTTLWRKLRDLGLE
jgi:transcriptional regulator of acetoin/glycerol metabolism